MTYNARRCETLQRLGIEQLPALDSDRMSQRAEYGDANEMISPLGGNLPVRTMPVSCSHDDFSKTFVQTNNNTRSPARDVRVANLAATQSG